MTTYLAVIQAAIPNADAELADFILWERTPFPCGPVSAQKLFRAASRFRRANKNNIRLCDWCDNKAQDGEYLCNGCATALTAEGKRGE